MNKIPGQDEAAELRRRFIEDIETNDRVSGVCGIHVVERQIAQRAFTNWTYSQIIRWALENRLTVHFAAAGSLHLSNAGLRDDLEGKETF